MHMADALISPAVGGAMWVASAGLTAYSVRRLKANINDEKVPLMGVLGAFIFAAQMINFTIPGTGSSGHLGGGMILSILLGPPAAFLTMASILTVQALFFADGGLLALGCNIFNLGFFPCFVAYPIIYHRLVRNRTTSGRVLFASLLACVFGLQLGAFGVVLETWFSGIAELPFTTFALLMQPIHLAIGVIEGLVTAAVVTFVWKARPEIIEIAPAAESLSSLSMRSLLAGFLIIALVVAGFFSWFASTHPDGLEWAMVHTSGKEELARPESILHSLSADVQEKTALLPDYDFKEDAPESQVKEEARPTAGAGKSAAGIMGVVITVVLACLIGICLRRFGKAGYSDR
jgi:cobalt/nickel transport system permease protein